MSKLFKGIICSVFVFALLIQDVSFVFADIEDGKDNIQSLQKKGEFQLYTSMDVQSYTEPSLKSKKSVVIPGKTRIVATERNGYWFLVNTTDGNKWIEQKDNEIELREIEDVSGKNVEMKLNAEINLFEHPFETYSTGK